MLTIQALISEIILVFKYQSLNLAFIDLSGARLLNTLLRYLLFPSAPSQVLFKRTAVHLLLIWLAYFEKYGCGKVANCSALLPASSLENREMQREKGAPLLEHGIGFLKRRHPAWINSNILHRYQWVLQPTLPICFICGLSFVLHLSYQISSSKQTLPFCIYIHI